jgi:hypothetical protein
MVSTRVRFLVLGGNPLNGSDALDSRMGSCVWNLSLGQRTGDGRFDGETFLGGLLIFFLGGRGGKKKRQGTVNRVGRWTTYTFKQTHFVLYYIMHSGSFVAACGRLSRTVAPILDALGRQVLCSGFDSPSTSPHI